MQLLFKLDGKMKRFIKGEMPMTGPVDLYIDKLLSVWNSRFNITQWRDEYSLYIDRWRGAKRLHGGFKITLHKEDALYLIAKLKLNREQSVFASGSTYRQAVSEMEYVKREEEKYNTLTR